MGYLQDKFILPALPVRDHVLLPSGNNILADMVYIISIGYTDFDKSKPEPDLASYIVNPGDTKVCL